MIREVVSAECKKEMHERILAGFLDGQCYAFAIAMNHGLGWPMVGLFIKDNNGEDVIRHAALLDPDGNLWDARGMVSEEEFGEPFNIYPPYDLRTIERVNMFNSRYMFIADSILNMAQMVWPDLPWKPETLLARARAFARDLEALSRKHGMWIYGNFCAQLPALANGDGDEGGYELSCAMNGGYNINRMLGWTSEGS